MVASATMTGGESVGRASKIVRRLSVEPAFPPITIALSSDRTALEEVDEFEEIDFAILGVCGDLVFKTFTEAAAFTFQPTFLRCLSCAGSNCVGL